MIGQQDDSTGPGEGTPAGRWLLGGFAVAGYALAMGALGYLAGFLIDLGVPISVDARPGTRAGGAVAAVAVDVALLLLFAVQHSVMARGWFKRQLTRVVPVAAERSSYVLASALALILLLVQWQPVPTRLWQVTGGARVVVLLGYAAGWVLALAATFQVSHPDLFGLRQAWAVIRRRPYVPPEFTRSGLHRHVRHPLMAGLLLVVWAAPTMTIGHLVLAVALTAFVLTGIALEERDLIARHGPAYRDYRESTPALLPLRRPRAVRPGARTDPAGSRSVPS